jgi:3-deoxy-D-arabino-heptulosonate 7-phosphate (DAHP) synthase
VTDGCIGWDATASLLETLAESIEARRAIIARSGASSS